MDNEIGDIHSDIIDIEVEISQELQNTVSRTIDHFGPLSDLIGELDCLLAFAQVSRENNYNLPKRDERFSLAHNRHPIQERCCLQFISNDFECDKNTAVSVLTGPNASGKSIFIKQIALTVFMNQIGCLIPAAEGSCIPIVDRIFTRIQTKESYAKQKSAFQIDLEQTSGAVSFSTENSLVLLDEFGKGTKNEDGAAIFLSVIEHFGRLEKSPFLLATTHFHGRIKVNLDCLREITDVNINWLQMAFLEESKYSIQPLFKITEGISTNSWAISAANQAGISQGIIQRTVEYIKLINEGSLEDLWQVSQNQERTKNAIRIINSLLRTDLNPETFEGFVKRIQAYMEEF